LALKTKGRRNGWYQWLTYYGKDFSGRLWRFEKGDFGLKIEKT